MKKINSLAMFEKVKLAEDIREVIKLDSIRKNLSYDDDCYCICEMKIGNKMFDIEKLIDCGLCAQDVWDLIELLKSDKDFLEKYDRVRKSELWRRSM